MTIREKDPQKVKAGQARQAQRREQLGDHYKPGATYYTARPGSAIQVYC